jgi:acyl-ACP thioesterase
MQLSLTIYVKCHPPSGEGYQVSTKAIWFHWRGDRRNPHRKNEDLCAAANVRFWVKRTFSGAKRTSREGEIFLGLNFWV